MKKLLLLLTGLIFGISLNAQNSTTTDKCKTDFLHRNLYTNDPVYRQKFDASQAQVRNIINSGIRGGGVYTIPVVVHVMHLGSAEGTNENISDAQIQSAIDNMNDAYANIGYNGLDIEIQFALAQRDPNCQPTDGINRINASALTSGGDAYATKGATDNNRTALKALSNWSNSDYYNIWIVTEIDNNNGGSGTQGYAYFPGAPNGTDGAVILYNAFGYDPTGALGYNLKSYTNHNATATHELGHALDLYHTFEGDDANSDGTPDTCPPTTAGLGDECADTDAHRRDDSDCQGGIQATCNGVANSTVYYNFMAYSSDVCQDRFTSNQKTRMRAAMEGPRASLLTSLALTPPPAQAPNTAAISCSPVTSPTGLGGGFAGIMSVTFGDRTSNTSNSENDGIDYGTSGYLDFSQDCMKYAEFEEGGNIPLSITTWFNDHTIKVYVDWNNDGDFDDVTELATTLNTIGNANSGNDMTSGNITIPGTATTDEYLRIRFNADLNVPTGACDAPQYGQVEDYAIFINSSGAVAPVAQFSANSTTVCTGNTVTFTNSSTNATTYSWNFGTGSSPATATGVGPHVVTYTGSGTSTVTLDVTGPGGSDNETKTNYITRSTSVTPSVSIVSNDADNSICSATSVTFTATPTNGGTPSYQWKLNGGNVGSNSSTYNNTSLSDNDQISCVMTSTAACASPSTATSNTITMDVISTVAASVSIVASANPINTGDAVTFTATPTNGGTPSYQWKLNGSNVGSNSTTYNNSTLVNGDQVSCVMTSTATCASPAAPTSNTITMTVNGSGITLSQLKPSQCNQTVAGLSGYFYCEKITNAQDYRFQFTGGDLPAPVAVNRGGAFANILRSAIPGLHVGVTYQVKIKVKINGVWGAFGPVCSVTIGSAMQGPDNTSRMEEEISDAPAFETEFMAYPNPTKGLLQVQIPELSMEDALLEVMDMSGKVVISQAGVLTGTTAIDLSNFDSGLYLIRLIDGESVFMRKIIKE